MCLINNINQGALRLPEVFCLIQEMPLCTTENYTVFYLDMFFCVHIGKQQYRSE